MGLLTRSRDAQRSHDLSNQLFRGEIRTFTDAMRAVVDGMQAEYNDTQAMNASLTPDEQWMHMDAGIFQRYGEAAREALKLYEAEMQELEKRLAAQLRAKDAGEYEQIADALESGDYSSLAW